MLWYIYGTRRRVEGPVAALQERCQQNWGYKIPRVRVGSKLGGKLHTSGSAPQINTNVSWVG